MFLWRFEAWGCRVLYLGYLDNIGRSLDVLGLVLCVFCHFADRSATLVVLVVWGSTQVFILFWGFVLGFGFVRGGLLLLVFLVLV